MPSTLLDSSRTRPSAGNGRTGSAARPADAGPSLWLAAGLTLVCAYLMSLAYPKTNATFVAFFGLAPLFWLWAKSSWKSAFVWGFLTPAIMYGNSMHWITDSLRFIIGNWFILAFVLGAILEGAFFGVIAAATSLICRKRIGAMAVFAVPAAWLLVDTSRSYIVPQLPFGELGVIGIHIGWLLQLAAFAGVTGLTAVIVLTNAALLGIFAGDVRGRAAGLVALTTIIALVVAGDVARARVAIPAPKLRVGIVQGNISQREKWSPQVFERTMTVYAELTRSAAAGGAKVVFWPETAITAFPLQDSRLLLRLRAIAIASHVTLFAGALNQPARKVVYNSVIDIGPDGFLDRYDKHILVPFAEYLPLDKLLRRLPLFDQASWFSPGPGPRALPAAGMNFGMLICFESAFEWYVRATANLPADVLTVLTDDAWFEGSPGPDQHADFSILAAVETGRWVVRGGDTGISMVVDPLGRVVSMLPLDRAGIVLADIGPPIQTPFDRFGFAWLLALAGIAVVLGFVRPRERIRGWRSRRGNW
jgi:apolipoprotein N-acyltransferase